MLHLVTNGVTHPLCHIEIQNAFAFAPCVWELFHLNYKIKVVLKILDL